MATISTALSRTVCAHSTTPFSQRAAPSNFRVPRSLGSEFSGIQLAKVSASAPGSTVPQKATPAYCKVDVGDVVPNVTLPDQNGKKFSLSKLKGKNVVLYFYPADDTPGCTKQACSFRDSFEVFRDLGAEVVGISGDSPESHKEFAEKYDLPFRLLSDEGNEVRKEFGVPADLFGFLPGRQTYVIDKKGVVQLVFNSQFNSEKHVEETVKILEELKESQGGFSLPEFKLPF